MRGGLTTGAVRPYTGTVKTVGKTLVMDTPIPAYVSFPLSGVEGSLTSETLHCLKLDQEGQGQDGRRDRVGRLQQGQASV